MNRNNVTKGRVIFGFILAALWIALTVIQIITGKNTTTAILYCAAAVAISGAAITTYIQYRRTQKIDEGENQDQ